MTTLDAKCVSGKQGRSSRRNRHVRERREPRDDRVLSRDDAAGFVGTYQRLGIFEHDPFVTLDVTGVGELVRIGAERGRAARPELKLGICGEHGGDPASIAFCHDVELDYVSCSPYRVPIARLAAAQAALSGQSGSGTA